MCRRTGDPNSTPNPDTRVYVGHRYSYHANSGVCGHADRAPKSDARVDFSYRYAYSADANSNNRANAYSRSYASTSAVAG